jgi:hypothetical protein
MWRIMTLKHFVFFQGKLWGRKLKLLFSKDLAWLTQILRRIDLFRIFARLAKRTECRPRLSPLAP